MTRSIGSQNSYKLNYTKLFSLKHTAVLSYGFEILISKNDENNGFLTFPNFTFIFAIFMRNLNNERSHYSPFNVKNIVVLTVVLLFL